MPNHCSSDLRINGNILKIKQFFKEVKGERDGEEMPIDADKIIPYPEKYAKLDKAARDWEKKSRSKTGKLDWSKRPTDGYNQGGYEWCIENWGTKWGFYDFSEVIFGKTFALVSFSTAWVPPIPLILKMSELFPDLTFTLKYYERGAGFQGTYKVKAGEVLVNLYTESYRGQRGG